MEYLYEQQIKPTNANGVPVKLTALDPNGNIQDIGIVTSDASGMFHTMWTPPLQGEYVIIAKFEGSASYGSSYAETSIGVGPAVSAAVVTPAPISSPSETTAPTATLSASPSATSAPNPTSGSPATTYIAIGVAIIIIVAAAAAILLRKRR
jgi:hypothetical protein